MTKKPSSVGTSSNPSKGESHEFGAEEDASIVLSILYGLLVVMLAVVFKVSENITTLQNDYIAKSEIFKYYLFFLFSIALLWMIGFKCHTFWWRKRKNQRVVKSQHASNKWLKAIVAIFGFSVIVKESLEVIGVSHIDNHKCHNKLLYFIAPIFHSLFALGQVVFLFFYAKIHIQEFTYTSRFGIMHAMATNLAVWIGIITDETTHALAYERYHHNHNSLIGALFQLNQSKTTFLDSMATHNCTISNRTITAYNEIFSNISKYLGASDENKEGSEGLFKNECFCQSPACVLIARADQFLSPMLIEFCLVASCLLYVTWSNVAKEVTCHHVITTPSYKFYKSYKGVMMGTLILLGSVIVMTLLSGRHSDVPPDEQSYYTEYRNVVIYDAFLTICNIITLFACTGAFYLFALVRSPMRENFQAGLDIILLFICLIGPFLMNLFSILSFSAGPAESKRSHWGVSLARPITDIMVSVTQILLILHGFRREPSTHPLSLRKDRGILHLYGNYRSNFLNKRDCEGESRQCVSNDVNKNEMVELEQLKPTENDRSDTDTHGKGFNTTHFGNPPHISVLEWDEKPPLGLESSSELLPVPRCSREARNSRTMNPLLQTPTPRKKRIILRDVIMFLVISNSCLWMLLSLNGTAFKVYTYESDYFGHSAWTTLTSVTAPLSIFLKLHSAACFFEIWSYS